MSIWKKQVTADELNSFAENTLVSHLQIKVTEIGEGSITATMPVAAFTRQPMGYLHGGASVVLAETLGSIAGHLAAGEDTMSFGVEINASHIRSIKDGIVTAVATPLRVGKSLQVWDINISDEAGDLVCVSRLTLVVKQVD